LEIPASQVKGSMQWLLVVTPAATESEQILV